MNEFLIVILRVCGAKLRVVIYICLLSSTQLFVIMSRGGCSELFSGFGEFQFPRSRIYDSADLWNNNVSASLE